jgi:ubiquinol-cytochrome c reductase cytochrome b subunit
LADDIIPPPDRFRWGYAIASALTACFAIEAATGLLLMLAYSPSSASAWGSVYYINDQIDHGWFVRGLHRFGSYAMVVLVVLHLLQATLAAAYRSPRVVNWWIGLGLMLVTLGLGVTGNILPWDQHGYWAAVVETVIAGGVPVVGPTVERLAVGGPGYGNLTLTRMYGLHVGILPALFVLGLVTHIGLARRHRLMGLRDDGPVGPRRVFGGFVASAVLLGALAAVVLVYHGAPLEAPADPGGNDYPARPEWYFLWLFQLLKYFHGEREVIATVIVPGGILAVLALIPLIDKILPKGFVHFLASAFVFAVVGGAGYLTYEGWRADEADPAYRAGRERAEQAAARAARLAGDEAVGIPPDGAAYLLGRDPLLRGGGLFEAKCAGCHAFGGKASKDQSAPDLKDYGTRAWVRGLLEKPDAPAYFGTAPECDGMTSWKDTSKLTAKEMDDVADFVATFAAIDPEASPADWAAAAKAENHPGRAPFYRECVDCHTMGNVVDREKKTNQSPDLFAWGSPRWVARMIKNPSHASLYGYLEAEQKMPAFGDQLTGSDVTALVRYLKGDYPK